MQTKLDQLQAEFLAQLAEAQALLNEAADQAGKQAEELRIAFLGKKGRFAELMVGLKDLGNEEKAQVGKGVNQLKELVTNSISDLSQKAQTAIADLAVRSQWIDISLNPYQEEPGSLHPVSLMHLKLEEIFEAMGFTIYDGPQVETDHYNFEALNFDPHHPARDMHDTFFFKGGRLLRTQTSTIQIRAMEKLKPPFRIIGSGKVFRCERVDASHDACSHQLEGMMVDKDISVANLKHFMQVMLSGIFESEVKVRLRPGYFPFVEPGFELEMACLICGGEGCAVCKRVGWIELLGCGMVHPNVLRAGGIDPEEYSGFAFGMGTDRLAMMKYGISDIRPLHSGDLNFSRLFSAATHYRLG